MNSQLDEPLFATELDEQQPTSRRSPTAAWKVLVVDDEQSVHDVTRLALRSFEYEGQPLELLHAYSAQEAESLLRTEREIAAALVDVVMETQDAGLRLVQTIREDIGNRLLRIILRTGQPGQAPEGRVIREYDINDYKEKTELTAQRLTTALYAAIRSYADLLTIDTHRRGLEKVISSTANIFRYRDLDEFFSGLLTQLGSVIRPDRDAFYAVTSGFVSGNHESTDGQEVIVAATGRFAGHIGRSVAEVVDADVLQTLHASRHARRTLFCDSACVFYFGNNQGQHGQVYLSGCQCAPNAEIKRMVELFCVNTSIAFENVMLNREIEHTQREIVNMLGTVAEFRSWETARHVERVAAYSEFLAIKLGLDETEARLIRLAAPLHDIGKVAIPDQILEKPGPLSADEYKVMQSHTTLGFDMLRHSDRPILAAAAVIARDHQERWDGSGYPRGVAGENIHLYGRIVAVADVFDALGSERCYKTAWPLSEILAYFRAERGRHFDPQLADILVSHVEEILAIRDAIPGVH